MRRTLLALASVAVLAAIYVAVATSGSVGTKEDQAPLTGVARSTANAGSATLERPLADEGRADEGRAVVPVAEVASTPSQETPEGAATLLVRAVDKVSRDPLPNLRVYGAKKGDEEAAPAEDVQGSKGDLAHMPHTDAEGRAELSVPSGVDLDVWVYGEHDRCGQSNVDVPALRPAERRELVVEIATGDDLHVFGRVVDEGGAPIARARVTVARTASSIAVDHEPQFERRRETLSHTTTNAEGEFELRMPSWRQAFLRVEAEGFALATLRRCEGHDSKDRPLEVRLVRSATLEVRVHDPAGGGVRDLVVRLVAKGYALPPRMTSAGGSFVDVPDEQWSATTNVEGRCTIRDLCPDLPFAIDLLREDRLLWREPESLVLPAGQTLEREWTVGGGCTLRGIVLDQDSKPVPALDLWLVGGGSALRRSFEPHEKDRVSMRATTDADGRFRLEGVEPGRWWLGPAPKERGYRVDASGTSGRALPASDAIAPDATTVEILSAGTKDVTLRVFRGLFIRGKAVDPDGRGVGGAWVRISPAGSPWSSSCECDREGAFVAGPLAEGAYSLVGEAWERFADSDPVEARTGDAGVVLRLRAGGGLRALVVDARTGKPCAAQVLLAPHVAGGGSGQEGISRGVDANGVLDWQGLLPGSYDLAASTEDGCFGVLVGVGVVAGEKGKELPLNVAPGGKLRLTHDGPSERVYVQIRVEGALVDWGESVTRGRSLEMAAPAGTFTLEIETEDEDVPSNRRVVQLGAGEVKEIRLGSKD